MDIEYSEILSELNPTLLIIPFISFHNLDIFIYIYYFT